MIEGKAARRFRISGGEAFKKNDTVKLPPDQFDSFERVGLVRRVEKKSQSKD